MLRALQGLLFLGLALFSLKWEFYGSRDKPYIAPTGEVSYTTRAFFETYPPWGDVEMKLKEAAVLTVIGLYLLLTGEVLRWRGQVWRYSTVTFLALLSAFLAVFLAKFAWHEGDPSGYYPPFQKLSLGAVYAFFGLLAVYYLVIGEVQFWRAATGSPNKPDQSAAAPKKPLESTAAAFPDSARQEGIISGPSS
jgi:hypothetical protein